MWVWMGNMCRCPYSSRSRQKGAHKHGNAGDRSSNVYKRTLLHKDRRERGPSHTRTPDVRVECGGEALGKVLALRVVLLQRACDDYTSVIVWSSKLEFAPMYRTPVPSSCTLALPPRPVAPLLRAPTPCAYAPRSLTFCAREECPWHDECAGVVACADVSVAASLAHHLAGERRGHVAQGAHLQRCGELLRVLCVGGRGEGGRCEWAGCR